MIHLIGGWTKNPENLIKNIIDYFENQYEKEFDFIGSSEKNYFMGLIKEKSINEKAVGFFFANNSIFKSSYYVEFPNVLLNPKENLNYDKEITELDNDLIFAKFDENKGIRVYVDKIAREKIYYKLSYPLLFSTSYKLLISLTDKKRFNYEALTRFLNFGANFGNETIFSDIRRLDFGEYLQIFKGDISIKKYWTLNKSFFSFPSLSHEITDINFWIDYIYDILKETFNIQIENSLTSLMSGGLDSTIMTAILLKEHNQALDALTIEVPGYGELDVKKAKVVSNFLKLSHKIKRINVDDSKELYKAYSKVFNIIEEPIGGSAFISRYFAFNEAKHIGNENIIVGDGADQIFAYKGKFILRNFNNINYILTMPLKLRSFITSLLHRAYNPALKFVNFSNNKDFLDSFDVIMKSDFLKAKNQFQSFYSAYQFSNLENIFKITGYKVDLNTYLKPFLKNHSYYPFKNYNRIGFNTIIFCANSDNLLNKALANYYNLRLFSPFISDIPIKKILPLSPKLKMINPVSKWILMEIAKKKYLLPENYFKITSKKKYGLYQYFLDKSAFEITISYILDIIDSIKKSSNFPVNEFKKYFKKVTLNQLNRHTSEYMKFNIWFGFLGWLNNILNQ